MNKYAVQELKKITPEIIEKNLARLKKCGVFVPSTHGIIISDDVEVGEGSVVLPGCILLGKTCIGENCIIGPNTLLFDMQVGNGVHLNSTQGYQSTVMDGCDIGPFAHIRPDSVVRNDVHLGNFVEVKNSDIGENTSVSHLTYIGDSDVGKNVNFGCGCVTVNYSGKKKYRTTVCDNSFIGCNTNLVAPVTVGKNGYTAAGSTITEDVPADSLAIARARQVNKIGWKLK